MQKLHILPLSSKKTEILCLSRNPGQFTLQVSGNTLQQVEKFKYLWSVVRRDVTRLDGARGKKQVWRPMFEPEVFWKQIYCIEESICDIVGTFRRPRSDSTLGELCPPFPSSLRPWVFASDGKRNGEIGTRIGKANTTGDRHVGLLGAYSPKQSYKTHQIELRSTINRWSFIKFQNVNPPWTNVKPPTENFLATVL